MRTFFPPALHGALVKAIEHGQTMSTDISPLNKPMHELDEVLQSKCPDPANGLSVAIMVAVLAFRRFLATQNAMDRPARRRVIKKAVELFEERLRQYGTPNNESKLDA